MMSSIIKRQKGFTLVETLIYAAGTVLLIGVIVGLLVYVFKWYSVATISPRVDQVGVSVADRIMSDIRAASSTNSGASSFGVTNGAVSLNTIISTTTAATVHYSLSNGQIVVTVGNGSAQYLTPPNMYVSALQFDQITTVVSTAVHFKVSIDYSVHGSTSTNIYNGLGILRNSYQ